MPLLLPTATRGAFARCWGLTIYKDWVAEVAVFLQKKTFHKNQRPHMVQALFYMAMVCVSGVRDVR